MGDFVQRQREAHEYEEFLDSKVNAARALLESGEGEPHTVVEAEFARRRAATRR